MRRLSYQNKLDLWGYGILAIFIVVILAMQGCAHKLQHYRCDEDDLNRVGSETTLCMETDYQSSFCFSQAKKSQCPLINNGD